MAKDAGKGKPMFAKRIKKHSEKMSKVSAIVTEVETMRESRKAICSTDSVRKQVFEKHELDVRNGLIAEVLKSQFTMVYQKTRPIPLQTNRERNLALRCLYGQ